MAYFYALFILRVLLIHFSITVNISYDYNFLIKIIIAFLLILIDYMLCMHVCLNRDICTRE